MAECPSDTELASLVARREDDGSAVGPAVAAHASECEICKARVAHLTRLAFEATSYATDEGVEIPSSLRVGHVLPRGTVVGRYHVRELLGAGAMGVVYAAYDPELDRKVALKILRADASSGPHSAELRRRLTQEAKTMARLAHANVVRVYDTGAFEDQIFIAMELVHGTTLRRWMESTERPWRAVLEALVAAGRGLAAAHDAGVVHRDFKPDNVLVAKDGRVLVTDFGLAGDASQPHEEELGDSSGRGAS
ncbi:MAG TPA: serine/threonine-protein kinase, partial [Byssovorax sp.]